jgi:hypothetical protein
MEILGQGNAGLLCIGEGDATSFDGKEGPRKALVLLCQFGVGGLDTDEFAGLGSARGHGEIGGEKEEKHGKSRKGKQ